LTIPRQWGSLIVPRKAKTLMRGVILPPAGTDPFYKWRAKFGGMDASLISRMKALDEENKRLK